VQSTKNNAKSYLRFLDADEKLVAGRPGAGVRKPIGIYPEIAPLVE
jgi:hypothetical protein